MGDSLLRIPVGKEMTISPAKGTGKKTVHVLVLGSHMIYNGRGKGPTADDQVPQDKLQQDLAECLRFLVVSRACQVVLIRSEGKNRPRHFKMGLPVEFTFLGRQRQEVTRLRYTGPAQIRGVLFWE